MRWNPVALVLVTGLLAGCASFDAAPEIDDTHARDQARMARNLDQEARDRIADELRAAELRYASGDPDGATWDVNEILEATGDARASEVLGKFALSEGRFGAAERHFSDATERTDPRDAMQLERLGDLSHLVGGFRAYENGALAEAERHWAAIADPGVRRSLARARQVIDDESNGVVQGGE